ncbi:hypothetical protein [Nocardia cyriacigeorgica]|uniref:hypothetical protein n=1 Tax=Nocardia cyriacigeorgica TaxID=135487 RepID=UPI002453B0C4|nr:hypothetical protein [Nocardia cyriacigeorgica]
MSSVRVDLHLVVVRRKDRYGFAIVDRNGGELATLGEGATLVEISNWITGYLTANAEDLGAELAGQLYAAYRAVMTG